MSGAFSAPTARAIVAPLKPYENPRGRLAEIGGKKIGNAGLNPQTEGDVRLVTLARDPKVRGRGPVGDRRWLKVQTVHHAAAHEKRN